MTNHIPHVLDSIVLAAATVVTAASSLILGQAAAEQSAELQMLLLPLVGALLMSGAFIMLNPQPETRRIVIGRAMISLFLGTLAPQLISTLHPSLAAVSIKPVFLLVVGGLTSGLAYVLSRPFTGELYKRAERIAQREADKLEKKYSPAAPEPPTTKLP